VPNKVRVAAPRAPLPLGVALGFEEGEELGLLDGDELGLPEGDELGLPDELGLLEGEELPLLDGAGNAFDCARTISEPAKATAVSAAAVSQVPRIIRFFTTTFLRY
jgi:hypothetical protein